MKAIARGCIEFLLVWAVACLGMYYFFQSRFTHPGPLVGAIIGSFLVAAGWGLLRNAMQARWQGNLIRRALAGEWPRDGEAFAAIGPTITLSQSLETPFQKRPCVLYSYELARTDRYSVRRGGRTTTETQRIVFLSGVAMVPWAVRTKTGEVTIVGFPLPFEFPEDAINAEQHANRLRDMADNVASTSIGKWDISKLWNHAQSLFAEGSGELRQDLKFSEAEDLLKSPHGLKSCNLTEQYIPVGDPICVLGRYDKSKGGLVNDWSVCGLHAIPGDAEDALKALRSLMKTRIVFAAFWVILGLAGAYGLLTLRENSQEIKQERLAVVNESLMNAIRDQDPEALKIAFQRGASPNLVDDRGTPVFLSVEQPELQDVFIQSGLDLEAKDSVGRPLLLASIDKNRESLSAKLIQAGADVDGAQVGWRRKPLEAAWVRGQHQIVKLLQERNASGDFVTPETGRELDAGTAETFKQLLTDYSHSLSTSNVERLRELCDAWPDDYFASVGRGLYANTRPRNWSVKSGYVNRDIATIIATGINTFGRQERYVVTFIKVDRNWLIRRDYWDEYSQFEF
ncbi:MAG TPA: hypothetical protein PKD64_03985 [Pirellulaceae bacterium]|nr:hypothetical protein [Pirellulaceae bacterium]HMO91331.1 hypothetical protein [Pirellulaceae bacterium]HMP70149.1 hypothetical protein [Pirellulaceae bacterium]